MTRADSEDQRWALLAAVLDRIVPAEDAFPAAGAIALDHVRRLLEQRDGVAGLFAEGLAEIERVSGRLGAAGFESLSGEQRDAVLRQVEGTHAPFFDVLVLHTYGAYYSHPAVIQLLGLDPRPPQPRGHTLAPMDLRLVERVKTRGAIYRRTRED